MQLAQPMLSIFIDLSLNQSHKCYMAAAAIEVD